MKIFSNSLVFLLLLIFSLNFSLSFNEAYASSSVTLKMDLELRIREKLSSILTSVDPSAQIVVKAQLKTIQAELPGADSAVDHFLSSAKPDALDFEDVDSVSIVIVSREKELPRDLKTTLEGAIDFPAAKKHFEYRQMDEETSNIILARLKKESTEGIAEVLSKMKEDAHSISNGFFGLGILALLIIATLSILGGRKSNRLIKQVSDQASNQASKKENPEMGALSTVINKIDHLESSPKHIGFSQGGGQGDEQDLARLHALPIQSASVLLSDCYWCEQDQYGAWLWRSFSPVQCAGVLKDFLHGPEYAAYLIGLSPKAESYHRHPTYLSPLFTSHLSQADFFQFVKTNPEIYPFVSPIRMKSAPLTLIEKVKVSGMILNRQNASASIILPKSFSKKRELEKVIEIGILTEADELAIFNDPSLIPVSLQSQIKTLAWFSVLPLQVREALTEKLNAQSLAQALIGPTVILDKILEAIPEKKRNLVREYASKTKPSRESQAFRFLMSESLKHLLEVTEDEIEKDAA